VRPARRHGTSDACCACAAAPASCPGTTWAWSDADSSRG
jgi:hypothetical protein